jgi:hypothetical protein
MSEDRGSLREIGESYFQPNADGSPDQTGVQTHEGVVARMDRTHEALDGLAASTRRLARVSNRALGSVLLGMSIWEYAGHTSPNIFKSIAAMGIPVVSEVYDVLGQSVADLDTNVKAALGGVMLIRTFAGRGKPISPPVDPYLVKAYVRDCLNKLK